jgi:two-component system phosphate regulon response regulator OmpR
VADSVLIVDDDAILRNRLQKYLEKEGFDAAALENGAALRKAFDRDPADLVILDLVMPGEDGLSLTRYLRERSDVGILILTGKDDPVDRVVGLEMGADDYLAKPFDLRELLARVRSILRRRNGNRTSVPGKDETTKCLCFNGWIFDLDRRELTAPDGGPVHLTSAEFSLLAAFVERPGRPLSRDQLLDAVAERTWSPYDRSIDLHISHLRQKIEPDPKHPALIKTVRGTGYVFAATVTPAPVNASTLP